MRENNNFVGNPECKRPLGRTRSNWEDNFKKDFKVGNYGLNLHSSGQIPLVGTCKDSSNILTSAKCVFL